MVDKPIGIYGFGRAGRSLAATLCEHTNSKLIAFCRNPTSMQIEHAKKCRVMLVQGSEHFFDCLQSENAQILFVAVSDGEISSVASGWSAREWMPPLVAHLSGAHSSNALVMIKHLSLLAQFHPLISLDGVSEIPECLIGISSENALAVDILFRLAKSISCHPVEIREGTQALYHASAAITGNLCMGLALISQKLMEKCGIEKRHAQISLAQLLKSAANALEKGNLNSALTGPIARGDEATISKHVVALSNSDIPDEIVEIYRLLSTQLILEKGFAEEKQEELLSSLNGISNDS